MGRSTQGVIVMRLRGDEERVSSLAPVVESEERRRARTGAEPSSGPTRQRQSPAPAPSPLDEKLSPARLPRRRAAASLGSSVLTKIPAPSSMPANTLSRGTSSRCQWPSVWKLCSQRLKGEGPSTAFSRRAPSAASASAAVS